MEAYAGMIDNMDYHIGRVIDYLKDVGEYDNTVIIFTSDNGPNPWTVDEYPGNAGDVAALVFDSRNDDVFRDRERRAEIALAERAQEGVA